MRRNNLGFLPIIAQFTGKNGSCGFVKGKEYLLWFTVGNGKIYVSRTGKGGFAVPYDTMLGFQKNWKVIRMGEESIKEVSE